MTTTTTTTAAPVPASFRAGVGAVIVDGRGRVLAFERSDRPGAWQCPQGGVDPGESWREAAYREVEEETGLTRRDLRLLGEYPDILVYELPPRLRSAKTGLGQAQRWFFFQLKDADRRTFALPPGEFTAWRWMSFRSLVRSIVSFKRPLYARLLVHFQGLSARTARRPAR